MGEIVRIGPLMLALDRLVAVAALWLFLAACTAIARRAGTEAHRAGWWALLAGVLAARFAYVAANIEAFAADPVSAFYMWQGGFSPLYGVAAAAVLLAALWRGPGLKTALAALLIVAAGWATFEQTIGRPEPRPFPRAMAVVTLAGESFDFEVLKGQPFVVNLWATWCPPCRREMPMLVEVSRASPEVPILLANQGEDAARVAAYLRQEQLGVGPILLDRAGALGALSGSAALPTTFFVDAEGNIRMTHPGEISRAALLAGIKALKETAP